MKYFRFFSKTILAGFLSVCLAIIVFAENGNQITFNDSDTTKVNLLIKQAKQHFFSDLMKTQEYALEALQLSKISNYQRGLAYSNFYLSQVYLDYNSQLAETYLIESLTQARYIKDSILINSINNSFGLLYQNANDHEHALEYFHKVLNSYISNGKDSLSAAIYNNLAISYEELNYDSLAIDNYLHATQINERNGNLEWLARNYQNLGNYYLKHNQPETADRHLAKSLEIALNNNDELLKANIYYNLYESALLKNDIKLAMKFARMALTKSREQRVINKERDALKAIIDIHEKNNRTDSAFLYQKELMIVADSIRFNNRLNELFAFDLQSKLEEQRLENEKQLKIMEMEKSKKELIYVVIILLSVLVLAGAGMFVRLQRNRLRIKNKEHETTIHEKGLLKNELDYKNRESTTQLIFLQKRNEYLNQLVLKLNRIADNAQGLTGKQLQGIINDINKNTEQDIWPEFELRFKETHNDFYKNLTTRFPNLTPNELKLCAFLKLNMSTKEISDLTNQNPDSLKIARHRLRTKLGLTRSENVVSFLNQI